jgi:hypothetical protein
VAAARRKEVSLTMAGKFERLKFGFGEMNRGSGEQL